MATGDEIAAPEANPATPEDTGGGVVPDPVPPPSEKSRLAIRINAGGTAYVDQNGNTWLADTGFNTGATLSTAAAIDGTMDDPLYQVNRFDRNTAPEMSYAFDVPNGDYRVVLHFSEIWSGAWAPGKRVFGVQIEGQSVESGLDIYAAAGANAALVKSYAAKVSDGRLEIDFVHQIENPTVSAIEILGVANGADGVAAQDGVSVIIDLLAAHPELAGEPVVVTVAGEPAHGTASVGADHTIVYVADQGYEGSDSFIYGITNSDGDTSWASISIQVSCASCPADRLLTLSWNPNPDSVTGYQVFRGPTGVQATQQISDLPLNSGLVDPIAPRIQFRAAADLGLSLGEQTCFRVKAYYNDSISEYSQAVCGTI